MIISRLPRSAQSRRRLTLVRSKKSAKLQLRGGVVYVRVVNIGRVTVPKRANLRQIRRGNGIEIRIRSGASIAIGRGT